MDMSEATESTFRQPTLKLHLLVPGQNYREHYDEQAMAELREQIVAAGGVQTPVLARPHPTREGYFEIIAGERRSRCARELYGEDYDMPVRIREATDDEARALGIIENHGRDNPSVIEEAKGAADLLAFNGGDNEATAKQLGWNRQMLDNRLLLLNCAPEVQRAIIERNPLVKIGHAELLAGLAPDRQAKVLAMIIANRVPVGELKNQLGQFARKLADACFDTSVCVGCKHNSAQQSGLFDESLGEGYCLHPSHYEELTVQALDAKATPLREQYQKVHFVKPGDGFQPLRVTPDGALGVGAEQMTACRGCANFGCALSATPGSYGEVTEALCFDAACHSTKVAARRKAERAASAATKPNAKADGKVAGTKGGGSSANPEAAEAAKPKNTVPGKVVSFRTERWRRWLANALMANGERNRRAMMALVMSRDARAIDVDKYAEVVKKLTGAKVAAIGDASLRKALEAADGFTGAEADKLVMAIAACAAYGVSTEDLEALLNYLEVDEARSFVLDAEYLDLLTVSELEALAEEVGLRKAMDERYAKAKAGKRGDFIQALLKVDGFAYAGTVPRAMRYGRRKFRFSGVGTEEGSGNANQGAADVPPASVSQTEPAAAAV
jgi:ParB family transcriptional regulator, chromosome partitioning protein